MERIGIYEWTIVLIGMGTTFVALIGLSWILSGFSFVARLRERRASGSGKSGSGDAKESHTAPPVLMTGISPELVAVITAAVAAASGRQSSEFRLARIVPSGFGISGLNTPVWGYANRLAAGRR